VLSLISQSGRYINICISYCMEDRVKTRVIRPLCGERSGADGSPEHLLYSPRIDVIDRAGLIKGSIGTKYVYLPATRVFVESPQH